MQHAAIDLGGRESQVCVRGQDGQILLERKVATKTLRGFLERQPASRVVLETCAEAFAVADMAIECQHEVRVVPATLVRSLGVGARGIKTDRRDAQVLSEVSCRIDLPSVHVPSDVARQRRSMCSAREQLIASRTALINCACGWARTQLLKFRSGEPTTLPSRVRKAAEQDPDGLPDYIERVLVVVESLNVQIAMADKELEQLAKQDAVCKRLMTVPGIGPVTSLRFVAALDDMSRFPTAHAVQAFLGLTPGEHSSSQRQQRTGITARRAPDSGASGMEPATVQTARSDQPVGGRDRAAAREVRCDQCRRAQARRGTVRSLARRFDGTRRTTAARSRTDSSRSRIEKPFRPWAG